MTVAEARDRNRAKPVLLVEITLKDGGPTLYFSDRSITVGGQSYEDYLEGITPLYSQLKFKNERFGPYERLIEIGDEYPFEGAGCVVKEVYLGPLTGELSEAVEVLRGLLDEPEEIALMGFKCGVSGMVNSADRGW